ncbi:MAG: RNA polymerase sigma factor [Anaerolineae bacterium]|nr:RNA polymerase sigma factor [Anaerolineae bacterium]NUQ04304.1 RNA polymerase sigma factor [Anaerolineae bacterium]
MEDLQSIKQLKSGDIGGLEALVQKYQVQAVRTAYLITHDRALAEDVVQAAYLRVYRSIERFDVRRPFAPYFLRIVVNEAVQAARRAGRQMPLADDAPDWDMLLNADAPDPQDEVEASELRETVRRALLALSPEQRAAIVMRYYLDLSEMEMSDLLAVPTGTIKWRLHAARKQLRGLLQRWTGEG